MRFKGHMRKLLANGPQEVPLPTHEELERDCRDGKAVLSVNRINHREFVKAGIRYFVGYSSERDPNYTPEKPFDPAYQVKGWKVYKAESEK